ncbi:hypothetical protein [Streptomyces sp. NPDC047014]|uniref:hypothetical protein n=1 Tax=Streptomyces sp. NPDC047014 TaxID=3155736 RepID=UPI003409706E
MNDIALLLSRAGFDRADPADLREPSFQTSLPEAAVRRLLDREEAGVAEVGHREVARRIPFLTETRLYDEQCPGGAVRRRPCTADVPSIHPPRLPPSRTARRRHPPRRRAEP